MTIATRHPAREPSRRAIAATLTYKTADIRPQSEKDWRAHGFVPCDRLTGTLSADVLPEIVAIRSVHTIGDRALSVELWRDGLKDDEKTGAELLLCERGRVAIVTRQEARARCDEWLNKARRPHLTVVPSA